MKTLNQLIERTKQDLTNLIYEEFADSVKDLTTEKEIYSRFEDVITSYNSLSEEANDYIEENYNIIEDNKNDIIYNRTDFLTPLEITKILLNDYDLLNPFFRSQSESLELFKGSLTDIIKRTIQEYIKYELSSIDKNDINYKIINKIEYLIQDIEEEQEE